VTKPCCDHHDATHDAPAPRQRRLAGTLRYLAWFIAFSGVYSMGAVCPFCGRQGCPTGTASAGMVGLVFASLMQWGRTFRTFLARIRQR
jgi:hypothetical protein